MTDWKILHSKCDFEYSHAHAHRMNSRKKSLTDEENLKYEDIFCKVSSSNNAKTETSEKSALR